MELAERARQMNRGRRKTPTGHTGLVALSSPGSHKTLPRRRRRFPCSRNTSVKRIEGHSERDASSTKTQRMPKLKVSALKSQFLSQSTKKEQQQQQSKKAKRRTTTTKTINIKKRKLKLPPLC